MSEQLFERKRKTYKLRWAEDEELAGLQVTMRSVSVESMLAMAGLADELRSAGDEAGPGRIRELFERFADRLQEWNLAEEGEPVAADLAGVMSCDLDFIMVLFEAWFSAVTDVSAPLAKSSGAGTTSAPEPPILAQASQSLSHGR